MTKRDLILFIMVCSFSFLQMDCKDEPPIVPPVNPLHLTVEDVSCTEAFLKISLAAGETDRTVTLKRSPAGSLTGGDSSIATITMVSNDSLFVDEKLLPNKTYAYTLLHNNFAASAQATTMDTTSHNVQWQLPDTLGAQGLIRDVWVFSKTDAWAVGEIYLRDSNGTIDNDTRYNAAHWDGSKWKHIQIPTAGFVGSGNYPIYTIFAFAPNDIWTFSDAGSYSHWNGQTWTTAFVAERQGGGQKLWGTSSSNIFLVGTNGSISWYDGNSWLKMQSNTSVDLQDIWGIDETHIWATGTNVSDGRCVVLQYDGKHWTTIYDNANKPPNELFGFRTLWTDRVDNILLAGGSKTQKMNVANRLFRQLNISQQQWVAFNIRGINRKDIYQVGSAGEVVHFNGYSWYLYSELKFLSSGLVGFNSVFPSTDFVLVGGLILTELNGFPIVIRGYR